MRECLVHINVSVPSQSQRVKYLINSTSFPYNTLQAAVCLVRANTNAMREDFELVSSTLIEVDPYHRSQRSNLTKEESSFSFTDFSAGLGSTGVDLRCHCPKYFKALPVEQDDELCTWQKTQDGKKALD